jgi:single-strand DNA-binding protein
MVNLSQILGRVGKIETRPMPNGSTVTHISMVTSKKFTKNGEKHEKVTWHNVTLFSKLSEIAEKYVAIGDLLYVQGEMDNQKYTAQDGSVRIKHFVIGHDIKLMPKPREQRSEPQKSGQIDPAFEDSDIPF